MSKIIFHIGSLEQGGAERVVSNLANRFAEDGYEIVVVMLWQDSNEYPLHPMIRRIYLDHSCMGSKISRIIKRLTGLRKLILDEKPDVVISFLKGNNYRMLLAKTGTKIPGIVSVRNDPRYDYGAKADKILIPLLFRLADGAVFQTPDQRDAFPKGLRDRSRIILNPVHQKYSKAEVPIVKEKTVVSSGRLAAAKNQEMLIRAFANVHEKHPDYRLKIYGRDGGDGTQSKLEQLIGILQASDYVMLMGSSNELEKELAKAEIYAFPSHYEGMPNALIEAMVLGMPVISTDCPCGGPGMLIKDGENGFLIEVGDQKAMEEKLCLLIEDKDMACRLGQNAAKIAGLVDEEAIITQWKEYIDYVITEKR